LPTISLTCPTRGRTELLRQCLDSLLAMTAHPERLEVVLGIDSDDQASLDFTYPDLTLVRTVFEPGTPGGIMHQRCYEASSGDYLMILTDDVMARKKDWDLAFMEIARRYPDGIFLIHFDDGTFGQSLCTMPFVSRTYLEICGGLLPPDYARYRGDDHITNIFYLLRLIGVERWIYLDEMVFEHLNFAEDGNGRRVYGFKDDGDEARDAVRFAALTGERKAIALKLAAAAQEGADAETRARWAAILSHVPAMDHQIAYNGFQEHGRFTPEGFVFRQDQKNSLGAVVSCG
jgi:hypothetical protein